MNYEGMLLKSARVYSNDPAGVGVLNLRAFVTAPIMVSPPYVSFYGFEGQRASAWVMVEAGLEKALSLELGDFTLHGKVAYTLQEVERGRKFRIIFNALPCPAGTYRGYLNIRTNYPEKPLLNIRIIGRFATDHGNEAGGSHASGA